MLKKTFLPVLAVAALLTSCEKPERAVQAEPKPAAKVAEASKSGQAVIPADSPQLAQIRVEPVTMTMVAVDTVSSPGKVEANANRTAHVVLPLTGRVTAVNTKIGDFVRQGQPLLTIESGDADAAVSSSLQAQASVTQAKSALAKAQMDLDRQKDLFEHGAVPQKEVLNGEAVLVQARAGVEQAQAVAEQAKRRLQILGINAGNFGQRVTVNSPISGKVLEMSVVNGEFRNDLSAPLMTITDLSSVWVTSDVPETAIRLIRPGEACRIQLSAYPGENFQGRVALIGDVVDPQTRTVKVRAEMPNPGGRLKPEMFGNIQLAERTELRPTVPAAAIISTDGKAIVWREKAKGVFEKVMVTLGTQTGDRVAIISGLASEDRVVVDGVMLLSAN
ncbi:MAG: efflux RND transporter periplasmic adaptor subunit [Bryobacteraceae bacterium]|nr:efflux RND transporter periplasmic adaptor subunit [Bryobacteraceae bacterium]